eukprot:jgi/Galph1/3486/GphlegSOOS_G2139.1
MKAAICGYRRLDCLSLPPSIRSNLISTEGDFSRFQFRVALAIINHIICGEAPGSSKLDFLRNIPGNVPRGGVCGTVWKKDELAYKCRTCERDPTCAICVQCFRSGNHEGHDFSIIRTGGGVCDCGDPQAWKPSGFCEKHGGAHSEDEDLIGKLPDTLRQRVSFAVRLLGEEFLLDESSNGVKVEIACWWGFVAECGDSFTRLVGMELCKVPGPSRRTRMFSFQRADGTRPSFIWIFLRLDGSCLLENEVKNALHSLYFLLITDLVFKRKFLECFSSLYSLFVDPLYQGNLGLLEDATSMNTRDHFSVQLFTVPALVPVMIRYKGLVDHLLSILLQLMEGFSSSVRKIETLEGMDGPWMTETVFGTLNLPKPLASDKCIDLSRERGLEALNRVIYDLRYVLTHTNASAYIMHYRPDLLAQFVRCLSLLQGMNGEMRAISYHVERESDAWSKAVSLELDFNHLCELLLAGFAFERTDQILLDTMTMEEVEDLNTQTFGSSLSHLPRVDLQFCRKRALSIIRRCLDEWIQAEMLRESVVLESPFDVAVGPVSIHYPLHRFLALLATEALRRYHFSFQDALGDSDQDNSQLATHILRVQSLLIQVRAGMWRRNGRPMLSRCVLYKSSYCQEWFFDLDITMLQLCCISIGASAFEDKAIEVFKLQNMGNVARINKNGQCFHANNASMEIWKFFSYEEYDFMVVEGFLRMLVYIVAERARIGYTDIQRLRRKLVHRLCAGEQTHSSLLKVIPRRLTSNSDNDEAISIMGDDDFVSGGNGTDRHYQMFEECLQEVGVFQKPRDMDQGFYRLRDDLWDEYDPFYPHYQSRERAAAEERCINFRRKHGLVPYRLIFPQIRPSSVPLQKECAPLLELCREFCRPGGLAFSVLTRCLHHINDNKDIDGSLNAALYLIYIALETIDDASFRNAFWLEVDFLHSVELYTNKDEMTLLERASLGFLCECIARCNKCLDQHEAVNRILTYLKPNAFNEISTISTAGASSETKDMKRREMRRKQHEALERMKKQQEAFAKKQHLLFELEASEKKQEEENITCDTNAEANAASSTKDVATSDVSQVENTETQRMCSLCHEIASNKDGRSLVVVGLIQYTSIPLLARKQHRRSRHIESHHSASMEEMEEGTYESPVLSASENLRWREGRENVDSEEVFSEENATEEQEEYVDHDEESLEDGSEDVLMEYVEDDTGESDEYDLVTTPEAMNTLANVELSEEFVAALVGSSTESSTTVGTDFSQLTRSDSSFAPGFLDEDIQKGLDSRPGCLIQSCGHHMHWNCFERYFSWLTTCHSQRLPFDGDSLIDVGHGEFLCPVCRRLANIVIPVMDMKTEELYEWEGDTKQWRIRHLSISELEQVFHHREDTFQRMFVNTEHLTETEASVNIESGLSERIGGNNDEDGLLEMVLKSLYFEYNSSDRGHVPFPSASSVPSNLRRRNCPSKMSILSRGFSNLLNDIISTIMTHEIAARSSFEMLKSVVVELRSVIILLRRFVLQKCPQYYLGEFRRIWETYFHTCSMSSLIRTSEPVDSFTLLCYTLFLWPEKWNMNVVSFLMKLCFLLNFRSPGNILFCRERGVPNWTSHALLYVRRCFLLCECIFGSIQHPMELGAMLIEDSSLLPTSSDVSLAMRLGLFAENARPHMSQGWKEDWNYFPLLKEFILHWQVCGNRKDWRYSLRPLHLVALPSTFQDLVEKLEGKPCKRCKRVSKKQTLCLICGDLLCMTDGCGSYPLERSTTQFAEFEAMRLHAHECAAGIGIFLLLKATWVLIIRNNRTAIWGSPYLDDFGEEDIELHRGKPLYLNKERIETLEKLYVTQGFDYDSRVLTKSTQLQYIALFR